MQKVSFFAAAIVSVASAQKRNPPLLSTKLNDNENQLTFTNLVNHSTHKREGDPETYQQRYWMNDSFWDKESGPVFLYLCGEWTCSAPDLSSYPFMVGQKVNANLITLEHRYYGASQPFDSWSTPNLMHLSSEQALADTAHFIDGMNEKWMNEIGRKPDWVTVGGSYPGALSAWFKSKYPEHAIGAWSSSGVIHAIAPFSEFDASLYTSLRKSGNSCPDIVQTHYTWMEDAFAQGDRNDKICQMFDIADCSTLVETDFFFYFADMYTIAVQYGSRTELCDTLEANMWSLPETQLSIMAAYGASKGVKYSDYYSGSLQNEVIDIESPMRQWTYQYCTEFGFFQIPNEAHPMRSSQIALPFWPDYCKRIFGEELPKNHTNETNKYYKGLDIEGSNIVFVNASEDPWQTAGMTQIHNPEKQSGMTAFYVDCNDCGHCMDFHTPSANAPQELTDVQEAVAEVVISWVEQARYTRSIQFLQ